MNITNTKTAADFFAGIGGFRIGFEKAGIRTVYANDNDRYACETYRENFGSIDSRSIVDVDPDQIPDFDIMLAGFPCQPFSAIGKRRSLDDERGKLFFQLVRILNAKMPEAFVLENVKQLASPANKPAFDRIIKNLEWLGYKVRHAVLDSQDFGVPQRRQRLYIVGFLNHDIDFKFPGASRRKTVKDILETHVDDVYYLSERYYSGLLKHKERHRSKRNGFGCQILDPKGVANTVVSGRMGRERNLIQDKPNHVNPWGVRTLTVREYARLQGFPDSFAFPVSRTQAYQQIGNAVTVNVVGRIARRVTAELAREPQPAVIGSSVMVGVERVSGEAAAA